MEDSNSSKIDDDDADVGSVSSSTTVGSTSSMVSRYFEPSDFLPWEELYSKAEYAPHVGFAVVAGGFACLHPFVFFAGVVTALGALRAATHTYEYAMCSTTVDKQQQHQIKKEDNARSSSTIISTMKSCDFPPNIIGFNSNKNNGSNIADKEKTVHITEDDDSVPALAKTASSSSTAESLSENAADGDFVDNNNNYNNISPSKRKVDEESTDPINWIKGKHPDLPTIALDYVEFRGLNSNEFFDVFFADDAPFGFPAFHKLRRDKEVQYGTWNTVKTASIFSDSDITPNNNSIGRNINHNDDVIPSSIIVKERAVKYHAKTNSFLGPPYALTIKTQRAYFSTKLLVIEIKTILKDIPFCNRFYLIERWIIDGTETETAPSSDRISNSSRTNNYNKNRKNEMKQEHNTEKDHNNNNSKASHSHCIYLTVTSKVYFTDECPFESVVVKESTKQISEISKSWNTMAQDGLKRTEETRRKRLRQHQQQKQAERLQKEQPLKKNTSLLSTAATNNFDADESIEIEHVDENDHRRDSSICKGIRRRSSTSQKHQQQQPSQQQPRRILKNRSISRSISKLLVRNSKEISLPKVHISSS